MSQIDFSGLKPVYFGENVKSSNLLAGSSSSPMEMSNSFLSILSLETNVSKTPFKAPSKPSIPWSTWQDTHAEARADDQKSEHRDVSLFSKLDDARSPARKDADSRSAIRSERDLERNPENVDDDGTKENEKVDGMHNVAAEDEAKDGRKNSVRAENDTLNAPASEKATEKGERATAVVIESGVVLANRPDSGGKGQSETSGTGQPTDLSLSTSDEPHYLTKVSAAPLEQAQKLPPLPQEVMEKSSKPVHSSPETLMPQTPGEAAASGKGGETTLKQEQSLQSLIQQAKEVSKTEAQSSAVDGADKRFTQVLKRELPQMRVEPVASDPKITPTQNHVASAAAMTSSQTNIASAVVQGKAGEATMSSVEGEPSSTSNLRVDIPALQGKDNLTGRVSQDLQANLNSKSPADVKIPHQQLAMSISRAHFFGKSNFEINVDPPELGRIEVRLQVSEAMQPRVHLIVERPETLTMIQRDQQQMIKALEQSGMQTQSDSLQFSLEQNQDQTSRRHHDDQDGIGPMALEKNEESTLAQNLKTQQWKSSRWIISEGKVDVTV